jgi:membrane associated rhomboid family serine protease
MRNPLSQIEVIHPPGDRKALEWIAALGADGLPYRLTRRGSEWHLEVPATHIEQAWGTIRATEEINRGWPPKPVRWEETPGQAHPLWSGLWGAGFTVMVFICFGPYESGNAWLRAGAVDSVAIADGQWWRGVTALTLHADFGHLASNFLFLTILGGAVCRALGTGAGWALVVASGIAGNTLLALLADDQHLAVGASTAAFGALGIVVMNQVTENFRRFGGWKSVWSRMWVPLLAGLALLGFLGSDPNSDIAAHGFGFLCGLALAIPVSVPRTRRAPSWLQDVLKVGTVVLIMFAWHSAIQFAG